jgi:hypothetical protein
MANGKRGRPKKIKTQEQIILDGQNHWDKTPHERKQSLGLVYLSMNETGVSEEVKNKFLKEIKNTPIESFDHAGWSIYKDILSSVSDSH